MVKIPGSSIEQLKSKSVSVEDWFNQSCHSLFLSLVVGKEPFLIFRQHLKLKRIKNRNDFQKIFELVDRASLKQELLLANINEMHSTLLTSPRERKDLEQLAEEYSHRFLAFYSQNKNKIFISREKAARDYGLITGDYNLLLEWVKTGDAMASFFYLEITIADLAHELAHYLCGEKRTKEKDDFDKAGIIREKIEDLEIKHSGFLRAYYTKDKDKEYKRLFGSPEGLNELGAIITETYWLLNVFCQKRQVSYEQAVSAYLKELDRRIEEDKQVNTQYPSLITSSNPLMKKFTVLLAEKLGWQKIIALYFTSNLMGFIKLLQEELGEKAGEIIKNLMVEEPKADKLEEAIGFLS